MAHYYGVTIYTHSKRNNKTFESINRKGNCEGIPEMMVVQIIRGFNASIQLTQVEGCK